MLAPPPALLALDPSSVAVGYALLRGDELTSCGVLRAPAHHPTARRIARLCDEFIDRFGPGVGTINRVVVEQTDGKVNRWSKASRGSGVAALAQAQGAIFQAARGLGLPEPLAVCERAWTRAMSGGRSKSKEERAAELALIYPAFAASILVEGYDAADAIGLGLYAVGKAREASLIALYGGKPR